MLAPNFDLERSLSSLGSGCRCIVGVDEVGRGAWAGPVCAGAMWLRPSLEREFIALGIDDSKRVRRRRREFLCQSLAQAVVRGCARSAVAFSSARMIDRVGIGAATLDAMRRAVMALGAVVDGVLVDGRQVPDVACLAQAHLRGDQASLSIAAASIIAKVARDHYMRALAEVYPVYSWETNVGYGTRAHRLGLARGGISCEHRLSFAPMRDFSPLNYQN